MALYRADVDAPTYYPTAELFVVPGDVVDLNPADAIGLNGLTFIAPVADEVAVDSAPVEAPVSVPEPVVAVDTTEAPAPVVDVPVASEDAPAETPAETPAPDATPAPDTTDVTNG
jgi:hypothetical protein